LSHGIKNWIKDAVITNDYTRAMRWTASQMPKLQSAVEREVF
jgi:hypothetical protein